MPIPDDQASDQPHFFKFEIGNKHKVVKYLKERNILSI